MEWAMRVKELFKDLPVKIYGDEKVDLLSISSNSKEVSKGALFIAKDGLTYKGSDYSKEAALCGASAVFSNQYQNSLEGVVQIVGENPSKLEGALADRFYQSPSKKLKTVGVTGTNGKTSTSYLIRQLIGEDDCGLIGTIQYLVGRKAQDATLTTPDVVSNHRMLHEMVEEGMSHAVMETTSIALTQNRLDGIEFDLALFTNLSQDHLDYHQTMGEYAAAKALLFEGLSVQSRALVNINDRYASKLVKNCKAKVKTYGRDPSADYSISEIKLQSSESQFQLKVNGALYSVSVPLMGLFNVYNTLAAIAAAVELGFPIEEVLLKAKNFTAPNGRLQPVSNSLGVHIYVDFAHTEDALKNVLDSLKEISHRKLITVFGCGGDRDPLKRPFMGKAVSERSNLAIITSDNPRSEDPEKICLQVQEGATGDTIVEVDRKMAIRRGLELAMPGDILLVAGRGHEKFQDIRGVKVPFEDSSVIKEVLESIDRDQKLAKLK